MCTRYLANPHVKKFLQSKWGKRVPNPESTFGSPS